MGRDTNFDRPLVAESRRSIIEEFGDLNGRYWEKRTFA